MRNLGPFLADIGRLAKPYFMSEERWFARGMLAVVVAMRLVMVGIGVQLSFWNNAFFNALQDKDWDSFINLLLFWKVTPKGFMPGFVGLVVVYIVIAIYRVYLTQWLQIRWRRWMTARFIDTWLADRAYYRISLAAPGDAKGKATDNPDQRIAEDLRAFIGDGVAGTRGILFFGVDLLSNVVSLFSYLAILWGLSGSLTLLGIVIPGYMVWVALLYAVLGTVATHFVGRPLAMLNFRKQQVEADFRFALVRLRENSEAVALYGGEAVEKAALHVRFAALVANWWGLMRRYKALNALTIGYGQVANIFPLVVAAPRYFSGQLQLGGLMQTSQAFGEVQGALSWLVDNYGELAEFRATVDRLGTFQRAIEAARADAGRGVVADPAEAAGDGHYALREATLALPSGEVLIGPAEVSFAQGRSTVISGRSGSGKSTLFRALAGIWPFGAGRVQRPAGQTALFLPQRPYVPLGTLRHGLAYPHADATYSDAAVRAALADCGLGHLAGRLDEEESWTQRLSGGELQRLAIARALLARPDWLFLDEATASLDPEAEAELYAMLKARLPGTTLVSIAHRPAVAAFHDAHLRFERPPGRLVAVPRTVDPAVAQAAD